MKSNVILLRFISKRRNSKEIALILHRTVLLIQQSKLNKPISVRQNKEGGTREITNQGPWCDFFEIPSKSDFL